jgi:membrane dipeptidase
MTRRRKVFIIMGIPFLLVFSVWLFGAPFSQIDARYNRVLHKGPYKVSAEAESLHKTLFVADLHADSLLFGRDLNQRSQTGHLDFVRMREGNVRLQMFTVVTKTPVGLNYQRNSDKSDSVTALAIANHWPARTLNSLTERALYQAERLRKMTDDSKGSVRFVRSRTDLETPFQAAALLGAEGAHALDGKVENLDRLYDAGFRMIGLAHFFDNEFAGSAHGVNKGGLTKEGQELVRKMEEKKMLVDLAHASPKTINDVLAIAKRPVLVSHTGVRGTCNNQRNLSDAQLRNIAAKGGLIGIGYWETATCGNDAAAIARAIKYAVSVVGVQHVALGSDYDGAVTAPFDVTGTPLITEALLKEGFSEKDIRQIMGENALQFFKGNLPD